MNLAIGESFGSVAVILLSEQNNSWRDKNFPNLNGIFIATTNCEDVCFLLMKGKKYPKHFLGLLVNYLFALLVFGHPQNFLFLILKMLFLMKQIKH